MTEKALTIASNTLSLSSLYESSFLLSEEILPHAPLRRLAISNIFLVCVVEQFSGFTSFESEIFFHRQR